MCLVEDVRGNKLLALIQGEEEALIQNEAHRPLTSALMIVKGPDGFMLLKNKYRGEWELAGGMIDEGESPRACAIRECYEESGYVVENPRFVGIIQFFLRPSYHWPEERIEYTALYCADVETIQAFSENDEMSGLCWYTIGQALADASRIDLKLLSYYLPS